MTLFSTSRSRKRQRGLTLVEILVALTIGLVLLAGIIQIFISSKQTYRTQDALSRVQENARFAFELLGRDVRMAGFSGCMTSSGSIDVRVIANPAPSGSATLAAQGAAIRVAQVDSSGDADLDGDGAADIADALPGTNAVSITGGGSCGAQLTGNLSARNANIQVTEASSCGWQAGDALIITDCQVADVFRATSVSSGSSKITVAHANSSNTDNRLSKEYQDDAMVMSYRNSIYFVRLRDPDAAESESNPPALYREVNGGAAEELVPGVEDMLIRTGIDSDGDSARSVEDYLAPGGVSDWSRARAIEVTLQFRTLEDNIAQESRTNPLGNSDRRLSREFVNVLTGRNLVP